ncbi:hypothetical protein MMC29_000872 [Sticta canariensis]|nr:hypothetical protein [Sticta canariensis]
MTSIRAFRPQDLLRTNLANLDPLTENYNIDFYLHYLAKWPSLFTVAEDQHGNMTGYMMGKVEEDPSYVKFMDNYLPWHGHVTALTVAPQYRRLGLAKILTSALERGCEAQNAWFVDLFVREGNDTAVNLYRGLGVFRRVVNYYSDDPTGRKPVEDAFDMRKPLSRDKKRQHIRENGEDHLVDPEDLYHG